MSPGGLHCYRGNCQTVCTCRCTICTPLRIPLGIPFQTLSLDARDAPDLPYLMDPLDPRDALIARLQRDVRALQTRVERLERFAPVTAAARKLLSALAADVECHGEPPKTRAAYYELKRALGAVED